MPQSVKCLLLFPSLFLNFFFLHYCQQEELHRALLPCTDLVPNRSPVGNCHCNTEYNLPLKVCPRQRQRRQSRSCCCARGQLLVQTWRKAPTQFTAFIFTYFIDISLFYVVIFIPPACYWNVKQTPDLLASVTCLHLEIQQWQNVCAGAFTGTNVRLLWMLTVLLLTEIKASVALERLSSFITIHVTPSGTRSGTFSKPPEHVFPTILPPPLIGSSTFSVVNIQEGRQSNPWGWWFGWSAESPLLDLGVDLLRQGEPLKRICWSTFIKSSCKCFHWPWPRCPSTAFVADFWVEENSFFSFLKMFQLSSKRCLQF